MPTKLTDDDHRLQRAWELFCLIETVERCDKAIKQYAEAGISHTVHDVEHREMRRVAISRLNELF